MKVFPSTEPIYGNDVIGVKQTSGMELRDYFAAQALQGLLNEANSDFADDAIAELAYSLADAMMEARDK